MRMQQENCRLHKLVWGRKIGVFLLNNRGENHSKNSKCKTTEVEIRMQIRLDNMSNQSILAGHIFGHFVGNDPMSGTHVQL